MSKLLLVVLLVVGGYLYFAPKDPSPNLATPDTSIEPESTDSESNSRYLTDGLSRLDEGQDSRRVLFFYASWCPTCRPADKEFSSSSSSLPADVIVYRVNYNDPSTDDAERDLARKYGVTYQHTFVLIDSSGEPIKKWNGGGLSELLANLES